MKYFRIIILILILYFPICYKTISCHKLDIKELNQKWLDYYKDTVDMYISYKGFVRNPFKNNLNINKIEYYQKLSKYLENISYEYEVVRVINLNESLYYSLDTNDNKLYSYKPQAYFLIRKTGTKIIELIYLNRDCSVVKKEIKPSFNFDVFLKKKNYDSFGVFGDRYAGPFTYNDYNGVSLSIGTKTDVFSAYSFNFWHYKNGRIINFVNYYNHIVAKELQKLLTQLYEMGVVQDEVFETECK